MKIINGFRGESKWLSNFQSCSIQFEGAWYSSVEHAYVAAKTTDLLVRKKVRMIAAAGAAKRFGRKITLRPDWEEIKLTVMLLFLKQKFGDNNPELKQKLIATGDIVLIEGNHWHDNFWGNCHCRGCRFEPKNNWLGKLLMSVRKEL